MEVNYDFRLSRKFTVDFDSCLESLHAVDMDNIANVWEVNIASVFKVEGQFDKFSLPLPLLALNGHQATPFSVVLLDTPILSLSLKMEVACISETLTALTKFTWCKDRRTELTSSLNLIKIISYNRPHTFITIMFFFLI